MGLVNIQKLSDFLSKISQDAREKEMTWRDVAVLFACFLVARAVRMTPPSDGAFSHVAARLHHYDLRQIYPYSYHPSFNLSYPFDVTVGFISVHIGSPTFLLLQLLAVVVFSAGFWLALGAGDRNLKAFLLFITLGLVKEPLLMVKPDAFAAGLFLVAVGLARRERGAWWWHAVPGGLLAALSYATPLYLVPLVFVRRVHLVAFVAGIAAWTWYGGLEYWRLLGQQLFSLEGVWLALGLLVAVPHGLVLMTLQWRRDVATLLQAGWLVVADCLRGGGAVVGLAMTFGRFLQFKPNYLLVVVAVIFASHSLTSANNPGRFSKRFPAGSIVFDLNGSNRLLIPYDNAAVGVVPGAKTEWTHPVLQRVMRQAEQKGTFDCSVLSRFKVDYVIESNLAEVPGCLVLDGITSSDGYGERIWRTRGNPEVAPAVFSLDSPPATGKGASL